MNRKALTIATASIVLAAPLVCIVWTAMLTWRPVDLMGGDTALLRSVEWTSNTYRPSYTAAQASVPRQAIQETVSPLAAMLRGDRQVEVSGVAFVRGDSLEDRLDDSEDLNLTYQAFGNARTVYVFLIEHEGSVAIVIRQTVGIQCLFD